MTAPAHPAAPANIAISIADVLRGIWRRKLMVLALTLTTFLIALGFVLTAKPRYTTEAKVLIENLETPYQRLQAADPVGRREITDADITSQIAVMTSHDLGERVIEALKLTERREFDSLADGIGKISSLLINIGFKPDPRRMTPEQRALNRYNSMLAVYRIPQSNVIAIAYESVDPATAAEVANALSEIYVTSTREAQSEPTSRAREWLADQIESLRQKVVESERAAEQFRAQAGLLKGRETTLSNEALSELNSQIIQAAAQRAEAQAKAKSIRDALAARGNVDSSAEVLASNLIQRLREQQVALRRQASELSVTYLPNHPKIIAVNTEIRDLDRQIRGEALKIVQGLEEQAAIAQTREATLRASLNAAKAQASDANIDEVKLRELEREAAANREILEALLNRYTDASARDSLAAQPGMARIIQRASVPASPTYPRTGPTIILAIVGGLIIGLGLAFLLEIMKAASSLDVPAQIPPSAVPANLTAAPPPVMTPPAVPAAPPPPPEPAAAAPSQPPVGPPPPPDSTRELLPALCQVPPIPDGEAAILRAFEIMATPNGPYASAFKTISSWASSVRQAMGVRTIAVAAVDGADLDSAAAAVALARATGMQAQRVIILDAAPPGQQVEPVAGLSPGGGLAEMLVGDSKFAELITTDGASAVHILRAGRSIEFAAQYFSTNRMDAILKTLEQSYDAVIINLGNLDANRRALARFAQAAVILAAAGRALDVSQLSAELHQAGLRSVQYVRIGLEASRPDTGRKPVIA
jgi:uncharacterized protein involved in exopolysaccharide biosynthesis/Mrp family chromosome partitioning ATPase